MTDAATVVTPDQFRRALAGESEISIDHETGEVIETGQPQTPGEIIRRMGEIRDERRAISKRDKELTREWESLDEKLRSVLKDQGMNRASTDAYTASISKDIVPSVEDWDEFYEYIREEDAFHLLERRATTKAFRELHDAGVTVPGVRAIEKESISLRKR